MVYETMYRLHNLGHLDKTLNDDQVHQEYHWGVGKGLFKVMAKMGISTFHSYKGFESKRKQLNVTSFSDDSKTLVADTTIEQDETKAEDMDGFENQEDLQEAADQEEEEESKSDLEDHSDEEEILLPIASVDLENLDWMSSRKPAFKTGKRIAIIGSGPSGLAAAAQLIKVGHTVVVYERKVRIGGLLGYGLKLDELVVDRRLSLLEQEGVRFLTNTEIGKHVPADSLLDKNDAIIVCTGSTIARDLMVEGRDAKGICLATEFLLREKGLRREFKHIGLHPEKKNVIIIGRGDAADKCIEISKKLRCNTVGEFEIIPQPGPERKPENPWPEWPLIFRVDYGHEEAKEKTGSDPMTYSVSTKRFLTTINSDGVKALTGLEIVDVDLEKDEKGAWKLVEKSETIRTIECDFCILAEGFIGAEKTVIEQLNLKTDLRSHIITPKEKYETNVAKVFAAGDCRRGQSLVVWAIHEGLQAARQVDEYLMSDTTLAGPGGSCNSHRHNTRSSSKASIVDTVEEFPKFGKIPGKNNWEQDPKWRRFQ